MLENHNEKKDIYSEPIYKNHNFNVVKYRKEKEVYISEEDQDIGDQIINDQFGRIDEKSRHEYGKRDEAKTYNLGKRKEINKKIKNVKYKKDEMGRTYFSKKKISYFLFVIAVFFTVLLSFLSTIPSNFSGEAKIYFNVGIFIFCLLWYILSIMFDVWYIHLEPTQIIYRNYLGAKKVIKASDIYYFERNSNGSLIIVCSDRKGREWI